MYLIGLIFVILSGCSQTKNSFEPGLLLTFDDRNITNWEKQIPLFAKYDAHVTFFIDHFDELTPDQLNGLQKLKDAGHSIGCHGLRHLRAPDYCKKYSLEKYIGDEIKPAIKLMDDKGFHPSCFAYPVSASNDTIDRELLKYFRHLRTGSAAEGEIKKTEKAFVQIKNIRRTGKLYGISFQPKSWDDGLVSQGKEAVKRISEKEKYWSFMPMI